MFSSRSAAGAAVRRRPHHAISSRTKADPNAAITENQPVAAAFEESTLRSLRSIKHVDKYGNPIADPDLSNPTRTRWERPLDTIRSFEADVERSWNEKLIKANYAKSDTRVRSGYQQRQHYGSNTKDQGGSIQVQEPYLEENHPVIHPGRRVIKRRPSESIRDDQLYPVPHHERSRDTMFTRESVISHSDRWPNSTELSSESSSIDKVGGGVNGGGPDYYDANGKFPHSPISSTQVRPSVGARARSRSRPNEQRKWYHRPHEGTGRSSVRMYPTNDTYQDYPCYEQPGMNDTPWNYHAVEVPVIPASPGPPVYQPQEYERTSRTSSFAKKHWLRHKNH